MKRSKLLDLIFVTMAETPDLKEYIGTVSGFTCMLMDLILVDMGAHHSRFGDGMQGEFGESLKILGLSDLKDKEEVLRVRAGLQALAHKQSDMSASIVNKKVESYAEKSAQDEKCECVTLVHYAKAIMMFAPEVALILRDRSGMTAGGSTSSFKSDVKGADTAPEGVRKADEAPEKAAPANPSKSSDKTIGNLAGEVKEIQRSLLNDIYGQDHAVNKLVSGYFQAELMPTGKKGNAAPKATFLFAGPPGVGKTYLAETAARYIGLPYKRFDMSEFSDDEAVFLFNGSNDVYKGSKPGLVTSFVEENPHSILLFDEIEKANITVIYLFLQILDRGVLSDTYTKREVPFNNTIIIFTTNVGKRLYEENEFLASIPQKAVLKELSNERNPRTGESLFPAAIVSRFASGNVLMFNHLTATDLLKIINVELARQSDPLKDTKGVEIRMDDKVAYSLLFSEGAKADARTVRGRAKTFFFGEIYELYRLMTSEGNDVDPDKVKRINFDVQLPNDPRIVGLFKNAEKPEILVFADGKCGKEISAMLPEIKCHVTDNVEKAREIILTKPVTLVMIDIDTKREGGKKVLNREDIKSAGRDFFEFATERTSLPIYITEKTKGAISFEEEQSFCSKGARGVITVDDGLGVIIGMQIEAAYQQAKLRDLARANKVLTFNSEQTVSEDGEEATITLFDYRLVTAVDADDSENMVASLERPDVCFDDVIGAEDAKEELKYFVDYMKNPRKFAAMGLRAPKGMLLYGPPGTGKTLLAKAMAGESEATYISMQGNQFKKKYVGEGPELVHTVFAKARKYAPTVLFLDEIDAIGMDRSGDSAESSTNTDILTALLAEMDGFSSQSPDKPVFVLAATNKEEALDEALNRRFDRRILIGLPAKDERIKFLRLKMSKNPKIAISDGMIENIAARSIGMSLSDLDTIIEIALRISVRKDGAFDDATLDEAFETFMGGKQKEKSEEGYRRTAIHETGHALVCYLLDKAPSYITIVSRADFGGYIMQDADESKGTYLKSELLNKICISLAGRAAEMVKYGDSDGVSTGPSADLRQATQTAMHMITAYGMDDVIGLGSVTLAEIAGSEYHGQVLARVNEILASELERAKQLIKDNISIFDSFVEEILVKTSMKDSEIKEFFESSKK